MTNLIAFTSALAVFIIMWAFNLKPIDAVLLPALIVVSAAAAYTYIPLVKKTIHGDE